MPRNPAAKRTRPKPKTVLRLPDLDQAKSAVLNSLTSADAQRGYRHAIEGFVDWYCSEPRLSFSRTVVLRYRIHLESRNLAPGTINLRLGAVRRLAYEASDCGLLSPDLAAIIRRVKGVKKIGIRLGNWLTAEQSQRLWQAPSGESLKQKRDRDSWPCCSPVVYDAMRRSISISATFSSVRSTGPLSISKERQVTPARSPCQDGSSMPLTSRFRRRTLHLASCFAACTRWATRGGRTDGKGGLARGSGICRESRHRKVGSP
jgi:hypothetical protein